MRHQRPWWKPSRFHPARLLSGLAATGLGADGGIGKAVTGCAHRIRAQSGYRTTMCFVAVIMSSFAAAGAERVISHEAKRRFQKTKPAFSFRLTAAIFNHAG